MKIQIKKLKASIFIWEKRGKEREREKKKERVEFLILFFFSRKLKKTICYVITHKLIHIIFYDCIIICNYLLYYNITYKYV